MTEQQPRPAVDADEAPWVAEFKAWVRQKRGGFTMADAFRAAFRAGWTKGAADLAAIRKVVDDQAEDGGLWFVAETAAEAYVQQELRKLHAVIERGASGE